MLDARHSALYHPKRDLLRLRVRTYREGPYRLNFWDEQTAEPWDTLKGRYPGGTVLACYRHVMQEDGRWRWERRILAEIPAEIQQRMIAAFRAPWRAWTWETGAANCDAEYAPPI